MAGSTDDLEVRLQRNDYGTSGEEFILKADKVSRSQSNSLITKSILSAAGDVAGKDVNLGMENYSVNGQIQNSDPDSYPSYTSVDTNEWTHATAKEINIAQAMRAWGPDVDDGFDTMVWGPRSRSGMMSKFSTDEDTNRNAPEQYTYTMEWVHVNVYIGDS